MFPILISLYQVRKIQDSLPGESVVVLQFQPVLKLADTVSSQFS